MTKPPHAWQARREGGTGLITRGVLRIVPLVAPGAVDIVFVDELGQRCWTDGREWESEGDAGKDGKRRITGKGFDEVPRTGQSKPWGCFRGGDGGQSPKSMSAFLWWMWLRSQSWRAAELTNSSDCKVLTGEWPASESQTPRAHIVL